jgi:hypothetical protein
MKPVPYRDLSTPLPPINWKKTFIPDEEDCMEGLQNISNLSHISQLPITKWVKGA